MSIERSMNVEFISQRAASYDIPGVTVDGNDVLAMIAAASRPAPAAYTAVAPLLPVGARAAQNAA